jgi:hypothetical protein
MEKVYQIRNYEIRVSFAEKIVQITSDRALSKLLAESLESGTAELVELIKKDYFEINRNQLAISNDSMIIEIWGHVYFEHFINSIKRLFRLKLIDNLDDFVMERCSIIDSGETKIDKNRRFWDMIAPLKGIVAKMLQVL